MSKSKSNQGGKDDKESAAKIILRLVRASEGKVWRDPDGQTHVTVVDRGHTEHFFLRGSLFSSFIRRIYYASETEPPPTEALNHALNHLDAVAEIKCEVHPSFVRMAYLDGKVYIDLANKEHEVVEVDSSGYRIRQTGEVPVKLVRQSGMHPLPRPETVDDGKPLLTLKELFNLSDEEFVMVTAYLVGCVNPASVYPLLVLQGGQGSGKSTLTRFIRLLLDPHSVSHAALPKDERDLMVSALVSHLLTYDNLSGISGGLSDALCRLATGGGIRTRALYTNRDEVRFSAARPLILNGIDDIATRNDLASRSIVLHLKKINEASRRSLREIVREFGEAHPFMLGALCRAWSVALSNRDDVTLKRKPRMLDFALWVKAAEPALPFEPGTFEKAYWQNIERTAESNVEHDPVASAVAAFMSDKTEWEGGATDLLSALREQDGGRELDRYTVTKFASALRRAAPALEQVGIEVLCDPKRKHSKTRRTLYTLRRHVEHEQEGRE